MGYRYHHLLQRYKARNSAHGASVGFKVNKCFVESKVTYFLWSAFAVLGLVIDLITRSGRILTHDPCTPTVVRSEQRPIFSCRRRPVPFGLRSNMKVFTPFEVTLTPNPLTSASNSFICGLDSGQTSLSITVAVSFFLIIPRTINSMGGVYHAPCRHYVDNTSTFIGY